MTKEGKCTTCRKRRVKCDERYPQCGACTKRNRTCYYSPTKTRRLYITLLKQPKGVRVQEDGIVPTSAETSDRQAISAESEATLESVTGDSVILHHRKSKLAKDGRGLFKTFKAVVTSATCLNQIEPKVCPKSDVLNVPREPISPVESLRARFLGVLGAKPVQWNPLFLWGKWLILVASRLGQSAALDDAALCFAVSCFARQNRTDDNVKVVRKIYGSALLSLQRTLNDKDRNVAFSSETIAATKLLMAFETMLALDTGQWISHCRGLGSLVTSRGAQGGQDDMFRSLYYSLLPHELNEAISNDVDSVFDLNGWRHFPPPDYASESPMFHIVYKSIMQLIVRIPRLVRLVRKARRDPCDVDAAAAASALGEALYQSNLRQAIHDLVDMLVERVPTSDEGFAKYYPESLQFSTICLMEALMRWCFCRILVVGLCRQLMELGLFATSHCVSTLLEEEVESAGMIAMSAQHAVLLKEPIPMGAFLAIVPLQTSFGSWCRLKRDRADANHGDDDSSASKEDEKAVFMMEWSRKKSNEMLRLWGGKQMSTDMMEYQLQVLEGGSPSGWNGRRVFPL